MNTRLCIVMLHVYLGIWSYHCAFAGAQHEFIINRHQTASLTDSEADKILAIASNLLAKMDGNDDVDCPVVLRRTGQVTKFSAGNGAVKNQADFDQICNLSGNVHVVREINYCGGPVTALGCSRCPGTCMIVKRAVSLDIEGVLWAHEFGHNQGLDDRQAT